jgi:PIN domain nuclease of toxin-antitoxin system
VITRVVLLSADRSQELGARVGALRALMRILLDTHILLWAMAEPSKLSPKARRMIDRSEAYVSAASIWEVSIKVALRKLHVNPSDLLAALEPAGFSLLPISGEHAAAVAELPLHHRDPFDRLLVAQAQLEPMRLLSNDDALRAYGECVVFA